MNLPDGWNEGRLGAICSIEIGGTPARDVPEYWDLAQDTGNAWVSIRDMRRPVINETAEHISDAGVKHSNVKLQSPGTVLLSFKLTIGRVAVAGIPLYTNEAISGLKPRGLLPEYLYHGLQHWDLLQGVDQAIKGATLNKEKLKRIAFQYPKAEAEQAKIAEILTTVDRAIEQTEALIAKQQRIKTGLMHDLLTRGIDEHCNLRSEQTHEFKDSPMGRIPVEWDVAPISKYGSRNRSYIRTGPFGSDLNTRHWVEYGVPVLTIGSLGEGEVLHNELLFVSDRTAEKLEGFRVVPGDIVFSRVADIGRSLVIQSDQDGWVISSNLMRISIDKSKARPVFLHRNIAFSSAVRSQLRTTSNSGGRELVNGPILRALVFSWPGLEEQDRINYRLDSIEASIRRSIESLQKCRRTKIGLMRDMLTGDRRVTAFLAKQEVATP